MLQLSIPKDFENVDPRLPVSGDLKSGIPAEVLIPIAQVRYHTATSDTIISDTHTRPCLVMSKLLNIIEYYHNLWAVQLTMTKTFLHVSLFINFAIPGKSSDSRNCGTSSSDTDLHIVQGIELSRRWWFKYKLGASFAD